MKITYPMLLFAIFLPLKLTGNIDWSWWWVTAPVWIPFAFVGSMIFFTIALAILTGNKTN